VGKSLKPANTTAEPLVAELAANGLTFADMDEKALIEATKAANREADKAERSAMAGYRQLASLIAQLSKDGWSQEQIEAKTGTSEREVWAKIHELEEFRSAIGKPIGQIRAASAPSIETVSSAEEKLFEEIQSLPLPARRRIYKRIKQTPLVPDGDGRNGNCGRPSVYHERNILCAVLSDIHSQGPTAIAEIICNQNADWQKNARGHTFHANVAGAAVRRGRESVRKMLAERGKAKCFAFLVSTMHRIGPSWAMTGRDEQRTAAWLDGLLTEK
jgi:hypothetical protein